MKAEDPGEGSIEALAGGGVIRGTEPESHLGGVIRRRAVQPTLDENGTTLCYTPETSGSFGTASSVNFSD